MPKYRVTSPDGKTFEITAPEGATQEQALAYAQQQFQSQQGGMVDTDFGPRPANEVFDIGGSKRQAYERTLAELEARNPSDPMHPSNNPTTGMSGYQRGMAAAGKSVADTWLGLKQLVGAADTNDVERTQQLDSPLMDTGAGKAGYVAGTVASLVGPGGVLKLGARVPELAGAAPMLTTAARAFLPTTLRGAAAQGVALGGLQPVGEGESRGFNAGVGGTLGAAGVAVPRVLGATYRAGRNAVLSPTTSGAQREAVRTIRSLVDDPQRLMQAQPSNIPGARRTLFEETGLEPIARLETRSRGRASGWKEFDAANDGARQAAIRKFAGDESTLDAAVAARAKATGPLYAAANKTEGVDTSRLLSQIKRLEKAQEGRPAVQRGLADIRGLLTREVPEAERKKTALAALNAFATSGRKSAADFEAAKAAMSAIRRGEVPQAQFTSQAGKAALNAAQKAMKTETMPQDKMRVIANARLTINDMLSGKYGGDSGQAMAGSKAMMAVKNQLDRVAAKGSPEFAQATQAFRDLSKPINRMQAGQKLLQQATSKNLDPISGDYPLISGQYGGKVKALDKLVQDATGFRKAQASNVFRPEDMQTIRNVQDDLSRSAARLPYGNGGGSHTTSQGELGLKLAGRALLRKLPWLGGAVEHLDGVAQERVGAALTEMLMNPAEYRRIAAALPASERKLVEQAFVRIGGTGGALTPALLNATE